MDQLWRLITADLKQRTRQQSFVVTLLVMSVLTFLFFPAPDAQYQTLVINGYRGIYNSAWIGVCLAMLNVLFLPIICFYLVKNALELDRQSMTGELIAATPVRKVKFLLAKWCASVLILVSVVTVMLLSSIVIQLYYGESYQIDLWELAWPQLVFVVPILMAIAAIAILFESIHWLKGGFGNVLYFFLWIGSIAQALESVSGVGALLEQLDAEVKERFPLQQGVTNIGVSVNDKANEVHSFVWQGIEPLAAHLWGTIPILIICVICLVLAVLFFDRFSSSPIPENKSSAWLKSTIINKLIMALDALFVAVTKHFTFTRLLRLELKLLLKGHSVYWFIGVLVLIILQLFISHKLLISLVLPISWLWCTLVISQLGQIEKQANTVELVTYSKQSSLLQTLACYGAAWLIMGLACVGSIIRFSGGAEGLLLVQLFIAISFTVSLAYFCGVLTGTKRAFEGIYPVLWYLGPIQAVLDLDFFGVNSQASWQAGMPYYFSAISLGLLILTISAKSRR